MTEVRSTPLFLKNCMYLSGKSLPTTLTKQTLLKRLALIAKCEADPPSNCFFVPDSVLILSMATVPRVIRLMSFSNNLDKRSFFSAPVEFAVKNLLPRPKIELSPGHGHHNFTAHDLAFHMRIRVVL